MHFIKVRHRIDGLEISRICKTLFYSVRHRIDGLENRSGHHARQ